MRCTHAEKLIPLLVGDDLPAREAAALRRHLESCANCRRLAAEFEESRDWMRGFASPQFDEAMLDDMRGAVLSEIGRVENRAPWFQWVIPGWNLRFVVSMAVLLLIAFLAAYANRGRQPRPVPDRDKEDVVQTNPGGHRENSTDGGQQNNNTLVAPSPIPVQRPPRKNAGRKIENSRVNPVQLPDQLIAQAAFPTTPINIEPVFELPSGGPPKDDAIFNREMTRIEFQTADPNIRIIWLTPKNLDSSSTKPNTNSR